MTAAKVLVAYTTNAGSTEEIAQAIGEELARTGTPVDVRRLEEVADVAGYTAVVVGAPMILGWRRSAVRFVKKHCDALARTRVAYFCTAMSLIQTDPKRAGPVPLCIDPGLAKPPRNPGHLSLQENYATLSNYLRPVLGAAPAVRPVSVAFFGGKLELFRLKWWQALFVMAVIQAQPTDRRDFDFIRGWAAGLRSSLLESEEA